MKKPTPYRVECRIPADEHHPATRWHPVGYYTDEEGAETSVAERRTNAIRSGVKLNYRIEATS